MYEGRVAMGKEVQRDEGGDMHIGEARKRMKENIAKRQKSW